jgi:hypothetical protein
MFKLDWQAIKTVVIEQLKGAGVKLALKKLLGTAAVGGFKVWLITFIVENLYEEFAEPLVKAVFVKLGYYYDRINGEIIVKKIRQAREDGNAEDYDAATDDVFGARRE